MNPHNSIEETQSVQNKTHSLGCPAGKSCAVQHLDGKCSMDNTCVCSPQSVQKEEIRKEFLDKASKTFVHGGFMSIRDYPPHERVMEMEYVSKWLDSLTDRISASVREETLKEVEKKFVSNILDTKVRPFDKQWAIAHLRNTLSALQKLSD